MKTIEQYFRDYHAYHMTQGNKLTHLVGIPMIIYAIFGGLNQFGAINITMLGQTIPLTLALPVFIFGSLFYLRLHLLLGFTMVISISILFIFSFKLNLIWSAILFVVGWIVQYIGHIFFEHKSPAFYKSLVHLLIGPIFIQNYLLKIVRYLPS